MTNQPGVVERCPGDRENWPTVERSSVEEHPMLNGRERHRLAHIESKLVEENPELDELFGELDKPAPEGRESGIGALVCVLGAVGAVLILFDVQWTGAILLSGAVACTLIARLNRGTGGANSSGEASPRE